MTNLLWWKRQGDLKIVKIDKLPAGAVKKDNVVQRGEATGHSHRLTGNGQVLVYENEVYLDVKTEAELVHEEHPALELPAGIYMVGHEREYDPLAAVIRRVRD